MKARMRTDLIEKAKAVFTDPLDMDTEYKDFLKSIEGKEVDLIFIGGDAFEKNDNNFWLPNCLWDEIIPR